MRSSNALTIPEIRAFLGVRSGLTVTTAADEAGLPRERVLHVIERVGSVNGYTKRGRTRR